MKLFLGLLFVFILCKVGFTQVFFPVPSDTSDRSELSFDGKAFYLSSSLNNSFASKWIYGGVLEEVLLNDNYENHDVTNRLGGNLTGYVEYRSTLKLCDSRPNLRLMVNMNNDIQFYSKYTKGLFGLLFKGNDAVTENELPLSGSFGNYVNMISIGGGVHNYKTNSYVTVNFLLPLNNAEFSINRGNLYTNEAGDEVNALLNSEFQIASSPAFFKGIGVAFNFDYFIPIDKRIKNLSGKFRVSGRNIGLQRIHQTDIVSMDADLNLKGFSVSQLTNFFNNDSSLVSDAHFSLSENRSATWSIYPGFIQIGKSAVMNAKNKFQSFFGLRMYMNLAYQPLLYVGGFYQMFNTFSFGGQLAYGGYGRFRFGTFLNYQMNQFTLSLGSEDLIGLINKNSFGQSALFKVAYKW